MLNLLLLRHAKSSWDEPRLDDFDRPLTKRGTKAAAAIGRHIEQAGLVPSLVLCSTAVRTRATVALALREIDAKAPEIVFDDALYLADAEPLLAHLLFRAADWSTILPATGTLADFVLPRRLD